MPATSMGKDSEFIIPSEDSIIDDQQCVDAYSLRAWEWEEHGYNKHNANEAFNLFLEKGLISVKEKYVSFESAGSNVDKYRKRKWTITKNVSVQTLALYDVPIEGTGITEDDAERQCNLMIVGELYRCEVIEKASDNKHLYLPTDIQNKIAIRMNKFELPTEVLSSLSNTPTSGTATQILSHPSRSSDANNFSTFLGNIEARKNRIVNGAPNRRINGRENEYRLHPDLRQRKFGVQKKTIDEVIEEQRQVNIGPVRQANIPVNVFGGSNDINVENIKIESFDDIKLTPQLKTTLNAIKYFEPTNLQKFVIPLIQKTSNDILCLAATGSGKSGAFLIPIVHRLQGLRTGPRGEPKPINKNAPLAIIVAHTKELIHQLHNNARSFAINTQVGVAIARGQMTLRDCREQLNDGCDILVITPGKLHQFLCENWIQLHNLQFLIVDEVDKFIKDDEMVAVIHKLREKIIEAKNVYFRTLMFSATFDECAEMNAQNFLRPGYYEVVTTNVNQTIEHVTQHICEVDCTKYGRNPRLQMLKVFLASISRNINEGEFCFDTPKTIVFVNEGRTSDRVAIALSYWGFKAMSVNGHRSMEQRHRAVEEFKKGQWSILVATDVISRGINLPNVKQVIVYEMPPTNRSEQYIHRIGRIGRVGHDDGHAYVFFDPESRNDEQLTEFLYNQLRRSNQRVPKFLDDILAEKTAMERKLRKQQNPAKNDGGMRVMGNMVANNVSNPVWNNADQWGDD